MRSWVFDTPVAENSILTRTDFYSFLEIRKFKKGLVIKPEAKSH
jgi:hypothetical protein